MVKTVLIIDDDKSIQKFLSMALVKDGYKVLTSENGIDGISTFYNNMTDMILLDLALPDFDGIKVLDALRESTDIPIIIISERDTENEKVLALDSGADDYLVKPFSFEELAARLRAMTRKKFGMIDNILKVADLTLDTASHTVRRGECEINLSAKEYNLLEYLMRNRGIVLSREKIENHIWNFDYEGGTNVVDVYISYLRKKIDGGRPDKLIHTVRGSGYVLKEKK